MATRTINDNAVGLLYTRLEALEKEVNRLQNRKQVNTPVYDPAAFPIGSEGNIAIGTDGLAYKYINAAWSAMGGGSGGVDPWTDKVTKLIDETVSASTTIQNDNELFFTTVNNTYYEFDLFVMYLRSGGGITPDFQFRVGEDSTFRGDWSGGTWSTNEIAVFDEQRIDTDFSKTIGMHTAEIRTFKLDGIFRGGGGTLRFAWAPSTNTADIVTVKAGSFMRYRSWTI